MKKIDARPAARILRFGLLALLSLVPYAAAQEGLPASLDGKFASAIVIDAYSGEVLIAQNPDLRRQPASMVKMMTELLILEQIESGGMSLEDRVSVSARASRMGGSQVYLKEGEVFTVEELLMALAIHSANDAAASLAEFHAGSIAAFLDLMNLRARELGMTGTAFHSVHGLPPGWKQKPDLTCARDMATLARELVTHPEALRWASIPTAPFRNGEFTLYNSNKLIGKVRGVDGLKTGYHHRAGFCITVTAQQNGRRLIAVVMGAPNDHARTEEATRLLSHGFNRFTRLTLVERPGQPLGRNLRVDGGREREVPVAYAETLVVTVPRAHTDSVVLEEQLSEKVPAPVAAGQIVGKAVATFAGRTLAEVPIIALETVDRGSLLDRILH